MALCACGCGQDSGVYSATVKGVGVKGEPKKFVNGHNRRGVAPLARTRKKLSRALKGKPSSMGMAGKTHTLVARKKMSLAKKGRALSPEHAKNAGAARRGYKHSEETKTAMSEIRSDRWKSDPAYRKKIVDARKKQANRISSLERKVMTVLEELEEEYVFQYVVGERYFVDFYLPRLHLLVEVDGEHWHKEPNKKRDSWIRRRGFSLCHLSEKKIRKDAKHYLTVLISRYET